MSSQRLTWGIGHVGPWAAACSVPRVREHLRGASIYGKAAGRVALGRPDRPRGGGGGQLSGPPELFSTLSGRRLLLTCWPGTEPTGLGTPGHVLPGPKPFQGQVLLHDVSPPVALAFLSVLAFLFFEEKLSGPTERQLRTLGLDSVPEAQGGEETAQCLLGAWRSAGAF